MWFLPITRRFIRAGGGEVTPHFAIPSKDLILSVIFYETLGCKIGRRYKTHVIISFFGSQLVCHKSDKWDRIANMYPRHLGVIFSSERDLIEIINHASLDDYLKTRIFEKKFVRKKGEPEEHTTFFIKDPSNNLIEFKWYKNQDSIF